MALRGKKPEAVAKRLKLFMYGPAGVGKSTAAIQFPNAYIIDAERGTDQYEKQINASGGVVFKTSDIFEVIAEVQSLLTESHDFRTLVIDPSTTIFDNALEIAEKRVGNAMGRHYGEAGKYMKRLFNLLTSLDMNVVVTAHAKNEYGDNMKVTGKTFDGWKKLDYLFDLVVELDRSKQNRNARTARVVKTRIEAFPDQDVFDWSYEAVRQRYGAAQLERNSVAVALATPEQVEAIRKLLEVVKLDDGTVDKWLAKAGVDEWEDMPANVVAKCIDFVRAKLPGSPATATAK